LVFFLPGLRRENFELQNKVKNLEIANADLNTRLQTLENKEKEREQKISEKSKAHNNTENTKSLDIDEKFE